MTSIHGRDPEQWQELVSAAVTSLKRTARLGRSSNYTDLNREISASTGQPGFDFSSPEGRNAMGDLLGYVVEQTYNEHPEQKVMLSALVMYLNENKPGSGFYNLAISMGLLPRDASPEKKEQFWIDQYNAVLALYSSKKRRHPRRDNP